MDEYLLEEQLIHRGNTFKYRINIHKINEYNEYSLVKEYS